MRIFLFSRKQVLVGVVAVMAMIGLIVAMGGLSGGRIAATAGEAIFQGSTEERAVALGINVDWGEDVLPEMLAVLEREQVQVTFFVTGRFAEKNPELVQQMAAAGHEIGNHGYKHPHPDQLSPAENQEEIQKTEKILQELNIDPVPLFAPPYGEFGENCLQGAENCQYKTIMWTRDTIDWQEPAPDRATLVERVAGEPLENGMIILMHPKAHTIDALPEMIANIQQQGFSCKKVSEVL